MFYYELEEHEQEYVSRLQNKRKNYIGNEYVMAKNRHNTHRMKDYEAFADEVKNYPKNSKYANVEEKDQ